MKSTSKEELQQLWDSLGIQKEHHLVCHSFLPVFGRIEGGINNLIGTLLDTVGNQGTIIAPSFTYSFMKNEIFHVENSPSTVGIMGDVIRKHPKGIRSLDANFSWSAIGCASSYLTQIDTKESFGLKSFFDKLCTLDGHVLLLGVDFKALPFFMYLEKIFNVDYRYNKSFSGIIQSKEKTYNDSFIHFVRDEKRNPESFRSRIGDIIDQDHLCKKRTSAYGTIRYVSLKCIYDHVFKVIKEDPYFLIEKPV